MNGLLNVTLDKFFPTKYGGEIMSEITCEPKEVCNNNEIIFKGLLSMWLAFTALIVPSTYDSILPKLQGSAVAAAKACTGHNNNTCGVRWYTEKWDGWSGLEEQMSVTSILAANLISMEGDMAPVTATTGGNSSSDPSAGSGSKDDGGTVETEITTGDRVGAVFVTIALASVPIAGLVFLVFT